MALACDARRATRDIDAVFKPHSVVVEDAFRGPRSGIAAIEGSCMLINAVLPTRRTHPSRTKFRRLAPLAQSAERLHGKEKVYGSIP